MWGDNILKNAHLQNNKKIITFRMSDYLFINENCDLFIKNRFRKCKGNTKNYLTSDFIV